LQLINIKKQSKETRRSLWLRRKARRTKKVRRVIRERRRSSSSSSKSIPLLLSLDPTARPQRLPGCINFQIRAAKKMKLSCKKGDSHGQEKKEEG
jgi:hypothetical protein